MRILVVAAHPDDELLGPGGTILRHLADGDEVSILVACTGTNLRYEAPEADRLTAIAREVATGMGAAIEFGELPDQGLDLRSLTEVAAVIEARIAAVDPQVVYVHHWGDINRDHRILCEATLVAARPYAAPGVRAIRCFETPSSTEWGSAAGLPPFTPNLFVDIDAVLAAKLEAFAAYESEVRPWPHPRSLRALEGRARHWGSVSGSAAAEAFAVAREHW
jgi:N-acetylglucosamine malate deacetylase 1